MIRLGFGYIYPIPLTLSKCYSWKKCCLRCTFGATQPVRLQLNALEFRASLEEKDTKSTKSKLFALETNGDVLKLGAFVTSGSILCYLLLLQVFRLSEQSAGLATTGLLSLFGMGLWIGSYFSRVVNKEMTYAQQLRDYEDQVLQRRLDELSEAELEALLEEIENKPPGATR